MAPHLTLKLEGSIAITPLSNSDGRSPPPRRPPQHGVHPGDKFAHAERLGYVIVGAEVQAQYLVGFVGPGGEYQYRDVRRGRFGAQPSAHLEAADVGQVQIQQYQARRPVEYQVERVLAGRRDSNPKAFSALGCSEWTPLYLRRLRR